MDRRAVAVTISRTHMQVPIGKAAFRRVHLTIDRTLHALFLVGSSGMTRIEEGSALGLYVENYPPLQISLCSSKMLSAYRRDKYRW